MFFSVCEGCVCCCCKCKEKGKERKKKVCIPSAAAVAAFECLAGATAAASAVSTCHPVHLPPPDVTPVSSHGLVRGSAGRLMDPSPSPSKTDSAAPTD